MACCGGATTREKEIGMETVGWTDVFFDRWCDLECPLLKRLLEEGFINWSEIFFGLVSYFFQVIFSVSHFVIQLCFETFFALHVCCCLLTLNMI